MLYRHHVDTIRLVKISNLCSGQNEIQGKSSSEPSKYATQITIIQDAVSV